jgi:hypothetical protein
MLYCLLYISRNEHAFPTSRHSQHLLPGIAADSYRLPVRSQFFDALIVVLTLTAICAHCALVVRSDATWRHIRMSPEHLTYRAAHRIDILTQLETWTTKNLDRKNWHGGQPIDAIGLDMQIPPSPLFSLPAAQHTLEICLDIRYICAAIPPVKAGTTTFLQLFWSTAIGMQ